MVAKNVRHGFHELHVLSYKGPCRIHYIGPSLGFINNVKVDSCSGASLGPWALS